MKNKPLVTICCTAYNHEAYISDCLEGFLMQKTNFPFEILIHDDASTDGTADIIRKYEQKYPDIIKPIYQTENQYSQGKKIIDFLILHAQGKYIALCEGDDFWINPLKLQKQFDFMEAHPDYSFSFHDRNELNCFEKKYIPSRLFPVKNWDSNGKTVAKKIMQRTFVFATQTIFFPLDRYLKIRNLFLRDCQNAPMGDVQLMFHLSMIGNVNYIPERMATYRIAAGSVSQFEKASINRVQLTRTLQCMEKIAYVNNVGDWWEEGKKIQISSDEPALNVWQHFLYRLRRIFNGYYFKFYIRPFYYRMKFKEYLKSSPFQRCRIRVSDIFL